MFTAPPAQAAANPTISMFKGGTVDGQNPEAPPVEDSNGNLWGTTYGGGLYSSGTVWELTKASQTSATPSKEVIYSFGAVSNDGLNPVGGLCVGADGNLYGTAYSGGTNGYGAFFQVNPTTGAVTTKYSLTAAAAEPSNPSGSPVQDSSGNFYFPCLTSASYNVGGIIKVSGTTFGELVRYSFGKYTADGAYPLGPLCVGRDGNIYGTTSDAYNSTYGTVFKFASTLAPAASPTIYTMLGTNKGTWPTGGLIQGVGADTNFYGTTVTGGANGTGDIFSVTTTGTFTELYAFPATPSAANPAYPQGTLTITSDGTTLFGTTSAGGGSGYSKTGTNYYGGNIFQLVISSKTYTNLWGFTGNTGGTSTNSLNTYNTRDTSTNGYFYPYLTLFTTSGVFLAPDGYIYGTGLYSGSYNGGTVYRVGPPQTYNYTYFTPGNPTTLNLSLAIDDFMSVVADSYVINSPSHGAITAPLSGTFTTAPTTLSRVYTPTAAFVGVNSFTYTGTNTANAHLGTSKTGATAYGNVTIYVGSITASANPTSVTGTTSALTAGGTLPSSANSTLTYTWSATGPAAVTYTGTANGINASKSGVTANFTKAGAYTITLTATAPDGTVYTTTVPVTVVATVGPFTLTYSPNPVGTGGTSSPTANAKDQFGNTVAPTYTVVNSGGAASTINAATGMLTAGASQGTATVTATAGSQTAMATVTITTPQASVSTVAAANGKSPTLPSSGSFTGANAALTVTGTYTGAGGNSAIIYTWSYTGPSGVTYTGTTNGTDPASAITANFTQAGTYVFTVTLTAPTGSPVTSQVTVIVTAAASTVTISPLGTVPAPIQIEQGATQQFTAVVKDQFGTVIASPTISWSYQYSGDTITTGGLFTAGSGAGPDSVTATSNGIAATSQLYIYDDPPTITVAAAASPNPVTGTTTTGTVTAQWRINGSAVNLEPESYLTYTWFEKPADPVYATIGSGNGTNAGKSITATFTAAGSYNFYVKVTTPDGMVTKSPTSGYYTVTVNQTATSVTVTPTANPADPGTTDQMTGTVNDQFGNPITGAPITWSVANSGGAASTISGTGLLTTGPSNGTATVTATSGSLHGTAVITIQPSPPTVATPAKADGVAGTYDDNYGGSKTLTLTALGSWSNPGSLTYTWSETSGPSGVTFAPNGTNSAKTCTATLTQPGTYVFKVTILATNGLSVTSSVTAIVEAAGTTITITPNQGAYTYLYIGYQANQQFTATETDQFGNAIASPSISWFSFFNTITGTGLYTASSTGTDTVEADDNNSGAFTDVSVDVVNPKAAVAVECSATTSTGVWTATTGGTTSNLTALGKWTYTDGNGIVHDLGESNLTYLWQPYPSLAAQPGSLTFNPSTQGNATKNAVATFGAAGTYVIYVAIITPSGKVTFDPPGLPNNLNITVTQTLTTLVVSPLTKTLTLGGTQNYTVAGYDQFGHAMSSLPTITWSTSLGTIDPFDRSIHGHGARHRNRHGHGRQRSRDGQCYGHRCRSGSRDDHGQPEPRDGQDGGDVRHRPVQRNGEPHLRLEPGLRAGHGHLRRRHIGRSRHRRDDHRDVHGGRSVHGASHRDGRRNSCLEQHGQDRDVLR